MRRHFLLLAVAGVALIVAAGCSQNRGPSVVQQLPPTKTPKPTFTATAVMTELPLTIATPTQAATSTPAVSPTPSEPTPIATPSEASFAANQGVNVRQGPGTAYAAIGRLAAGAGGKITAKNGDGTWYQFSYNGDPGWVIAELVTVSGDVEGVKVAQNIAPPPTARPRPTAAPQPAATSRPPNQPAVPAPGPAPVAGTTWRLQSEGNSAPNCGVPHFDGRVLFPNGAPQNGVCVYLGYYGPRSIKCTGCGGTGDGNWSFAPCGNGACTGQIEIYVVACPGSVPAAGLTLSPDSSPPPPANSQKFTATITNKCTTGQWTGITFTGPH